MWVASFCSYSENNCYASVAYTYLSRLGDEMESGDVTEAKIRALVSTLAVYSFNEEGTSLPTLNCETITADDGDVFVASPAFQQSLQRD